MKTIILCLFLVNFISCEINNDVESKLQTLSHGNGLIIRIEKNLVNVAKTETGFKINFSADDDRAINELEIAKSSSIPEDLSTYEVKTIQGTDYLYKLETVSEGSGGDEYVFRIWKSTKGGGILLEYYTQKESKPVFDQVWDIIQGSN